MSSFCVVGDLGVDRVLVLSFTLRIVFYYIGSRWDWDLTLPSITAPLALVYRPLPPDISIYLAAAT